MKKNILYGVIILSYLTVISCQNSHNEMRFKTAEGIDKTLPGEISYNFHIKPILSDRCYTCHGPDEKARKAELRLDLKEGLFRDLQETEGVVIDKGNPMHSGLYQRIISDDPDMMMPPPDAHLTLSEYEVALIEKWIDQGANWQAHWSFIAAEKPDVPDSDFEDAVNNPIDNFIHEKLVENDLEPSDPASKERLLRRVYFDLTGLPPSLKELDGFLADESDNAFEKIVDQLLDSDAHAERLTTDWLDLARYADTHGYQGDVHRDAWAWRDWVITSFKKNMPYDEFVSWQLAGDKYENPSREQLVATTFNRNHMQNGEGGIIEEEYRVEYVADRTNTLGTAFLGLTLECARCHDHKFDPISQKEYYQTFAFFNHVRERGMTVNQDASYPYILLTTHKTDSILNFLNGMLSENEKEIEEARLVARKEFSIEKTDLKKFDLDDSLFVHLPFDRLYRDTLFQNIGSSGEPAMLVEESKIVQGIVNNAVYFDGNNTMGIPKIANMEFNEAFSFAMWAKFPEPFERSDIFGNLSFDFMGETGYRCSIAGDKIEMQFNHLWSDNYLNASTSTAFPVGEWTHFAVTYDGSGTAKGIKFYFNGKETGTTVNHDNITKTMMSWGYLKIGSESFRDGALDDFRWYKRKLSLAEIKTLADPERNIVEPENEDEYFDYFLTNQDASLAARLKERRKLLFDRIKLLDSVPNHMVMWDLDTLRETRILNRGAYDDPGDVVQAGTPKSVLDFDPELPKNRLGLAKWLFSEENPLTSRVAVNRYWQLVFGRGIVATPEDFGSQGDLPSHPELLDWLATDFLESGWDVRKMIKLMVMSSTYQQSARISEAALQKDPENIFLARAPRYRMSAEMIRDNALAVSGLLVRQVGGPSVKPYQPPNIWSEKASSVLNQYIQDHGDSLYRRTLYTYWRRTTPPPSMITFDMPERNSCTVKRQNTTTPLQALVMLNDVQFFEAARMLAQRVILEEPNDSSEQIKSAFRRATSRWPSDSELKTLQNLLTESTDTYEKNPAEASKMVAFGESVANEKISSSSLAAMTLVTSTIMNLDEAINLQ